MGAAVLWDRQTGEANWISWRTLAKAKAALIGLIVYFTICQLFVEWTEVKSASSPLRNWTRKSSFFSDLPPFCDAYKTRHLCCLTSCLLIAHLQRGRRVVQSPSTVVSSASQRSYYICLSSLCSPLKNCPHPTKPCVTAMPHNHKVDQGAWSYYGDLLHLACVDTQQQGIPQHGGTFTLSKALATFTCYWFSCKGQPKVNPPWFKA